MQSPSVTALIALLVASNVAWFGIWKWYSVPGISNHNHVPQLDPSPIQAPPTDAKVAFAGLEPTAECDLQCQVNLGKAALQGGQIELAMHVCTEVTKQNSCQHGAFTCLGRSFIANGSITQACHALKNALVCNATDSDARASLHAVAWKLPQPELLNILEVVAAHTRSTEDLYVLAEAQTNYSLRQNAMETLALGLEQNPKHVPSLYALAELQLNLQLEAQALQNARKVIALEPQSSTGHVLMGMALMSLQRLEEAVAALQVAAAANDCSLQCEWQLGLALLRSGRTEEGAQVLRNAFQKNSTNQLLALELGRVLLQLSASSPTNGHADVDEAYVVLLQAVRLDPAQYSAHYLLGLSQRRLGLWEDALASFLEATRLQPDGGTEALVALADTAVERAQTHGPIREWISALMQRNNPLLFPESDSTSTDRALRESRAAEYMSEVLATHAEDMFEEMEDSKTIESGDNRVNVDEPVPVSLANLSIDSFSPNVEEGPTSFVSTDEGRIDLFCSEQSCRGETCNNEFKDAPILITTAEDAQLVNVDTSSAVLVDLPTNSSASVGLADASSNTTIPSGASEPSMSDLQAALSYIKLADAYSGRRQYKLAAQQLSKGVKRAPNFSEVYVLRARTYQHLGDALNAAEDYLTALRLQPGNASILSALDHVTKILHSEKRYPSVLRALDVLRSHNDSAQLNLTYAQALAATGQASEAISVLSELATSISNSTRNVSISGIQYCQSVFQLYSQLLEAQNHTSTAETVLLQLSEFQKIRDPFAAILTLADFYSRTNNSAKALTALQDALLLRPENGSLHLQAAILMEDYVGNMSAASEHYERATNFGEMNTRIRRFFAQSTHVNGTINGTRNTSDAGVWVGQTRKHQTKTRSRWVVKDEVKFSDEKLLALGNKDASFNPALESALKAMSMDASSATSFEQKPQKSAAGQNFEDALLSFQDSDNSVHMTSTESLPQTLEPQPELSFSTEELLNRFRAMSQVDNSLTQAAPGQRRSDSSRVVDSEALQFASSKEFHRPNLNANVDLKAESYTDGSKLSQIQPDSSSSSTKSFRALGKQLF